jgi:hypothetical protein
MRPLTRGKVNPEKTPLRRSIPIRCREFQSIGTTRFRTLSLITGPAYRVIDSSVIDSQPRGGSFSARSVVTRNGSGTRAGYLGCHAGGAS